MITSKQRAFLRGLANGKNSTFQIGKGGVSDAQIKLISDALEKHEIVKIHVLENALVDARTVCDEVSALTGAEQVQVIGSRFVLYRQSKENKTIDLKNLKIIEKPKKVNKPTATKKDKPQKSFKEQRGARGLKSTYKPRAAKGVKKSGNR